MTVTALPGPPGRVGSAAGHQGNSKCVSTSHYERHVSQLKLVYCTSFVSEKHQEKQCYA